MPTPDFPGDFLFLDESGDLGLGPKSTPIFVLGILHLRSETALKRAIKRARKKSLGRGAPANELKWSNSNDRVREAVIDEICRESEHVVGVSATVVEKGWINPTHAARALNVRYNYAAKYAMEQGRLFDSTIRKNVRLTIDARNRSATETLTEYVRLLSANDEICCAVDVRPGDSQRIPQLQVADFAVGAIYHAYCYNDWRFLECFRARGIRFRLRTLRAKKTEKKPAP